MVEDRELHLLARWIGDRLELRRIEQRTAAKPELDLTVREDRGRCHARIGREVVARLNDRRVMVDLSHSGRQTCLDAARASREQPLDRRADEPLPHIVGAASRPGRRRRRRAARRARERRDCGAGRAHPLAGSRVRLSRDGSFGILVADVATPLVKKYFGQEDPIGRQVQNTRADTTTVSPSFGRPISSSPTSTAAVWSAGRSRMMPLGPSPSMWMTAGSLTREKMPPPCEMSDLS